MSNALMKRDLENRNMIMDYVNDFGIKGINKEEQLELLGRYRYEDDLEARNELLESMYLIIESYVNNLKRKDNEIDTVDKFSEGVLLVMKSFDSYDFESGVKVSTYANVYLSRLSENIRIGIKNDKGNSIKMSRSFREQMNVIYKYINDFEEVNGFPPSEEDIISNVKIKKVNLTVKKLREMMDLNNYDEIDNVIYNDGEELGIFEVIGDSSVDVEGEVINKIMMEKEKVESNNIINEVKTILNERELELFEFVVESSSLEKKVTYKEIGEKFGYSLQNATQLVNKLKNKVLLNISENYKETMKNLIGEMNRTERRIIDLYENNTLGKHTNIAKNFNIEVKLVKEFINYYENKKKKCIKENELDFYKLIYLSN